MPVGVAPHRAQAVSMAHTYSKKKHNLQNSTACVTNGMIRPAGYPAPPKLGTTQPPGHQPTKKEKSIGTTRNSYFRHLPQHCGRNTTPMASRVHSQHINQGVINNRWSCQAIPYAYISQADIQARILPRNDIMCTGCLMVIMMQICSICGFHSMHLSRSTANEAECAQSVHSQQKNENRGFDLPTGLAECYPKSVLAECHQLQSRLANTTLGSSW